MITRDTEMHLLLDEQLRRYRDINREAWKFEEIEPKLRRIAFRKRH